MLCLSKISSFLGQGDLADGTVVTSAVLREARAARGSNRLLLLSGFPRNLSQAHELRREVCVCVCVCACMRVNPLCI